MIISISNSINKERLDRAHLLGFDTSQIWYHGTSKNITHFNLSNFGANDFGWHGKGIYFANSPEAAEPYSGYVSDLSQKKMEQKIERIGNPIIMPVYLGGVIRETTDTGANIDNLSVDVLVIDYKNGYKEAVVKNMSKIRGIYAKFNLSKANSTNIRD